MDTWSQISPSLVPSDETEHWQRQAAEQRCRRNQRAKEANDGGGPAMYPDTLAKKQRGQLKKQRKSVEG